MNMKTGSSLLLYTRNTPQPQRQTLPHSKHLGKGFPIKCTEETSGVAMLITNKSDFKLKTIRRDGEEHFVLIAGTIHQDDV